MNIKSYLIAISFALVLADKRLFQINQRFKERSANLEKINLTITDKSSTLQQELEQYSQLHQSKQFKDFKADPDYSSQILLTKSGRWNQSIYFSGKQLNNLLMQTTVVHKGDNHNHDKDAINLYLINTATTEVIIATTVKHIKLFKVEVQSELYQLRISYDWSNEKSEDIQISKHVSINIDIDAIIASQVPQTATPKDEKIASQKLAAIKNETDRIFIGSLQIWQLIQTHHNEFFVHQEEVYLRAFFQLLIVFAINCIEWLLLRRTLRFKSVI